MADRDEAIFSYGTLQQANVQLARFGRSLAGNADGLCGYRVGSVAIGDPEVVRQSGAARHPALVATGDASHRIAGTLYWLTGDELAAADAYEAGEYRRQRVTLESGRDAWVYVAAPGLEVE